MAPPQRAAPPARNADRVKDFGFRISDFGSSVPAAETCDRPRSHPKSEIRNPKSFFKLLLPGSIERHRALAGLHIEVDHLVRLRRDHLLILGKLFEPRKGFRIS